MLGGIPTMLTLPFNHNQSPRPLLALCSFSHQNPEGTLCLLGTPSLVLVLNILHLYSLVGALCHVSGHSNKFLSGDPAYL